MSVTIRKIKKEDNAILANIIRSCFHDFEVVNKEGTVYTDPTTDDLFSLFQKEKSVLFVAEQDGELLGCCGIYPTKGLPKACVELVKFYLSKNARGKGIGRLLMTKCLDQAVSFGFSSVYLESIPEFSTAVSIYEKQGFEYLNQPLGDTGHSGCGIWLLKHL